VTSDWYEIGAYDRMNALLLDVEGGGDLNYFRRQGRETAKRLLDAGLYGQLKYLERVREVQGEPVSVRFEAFGRDLTLLASLSGSLLNFSVWTARPDSEHENRYVIEVSNAEAYPESLCWRSEGFVNGFAAIHGDADLWTWERPSPDRVLFRMNRPI
jgi:hypothetical protein